jgi:hypothetical protein
LAFNRNALHNYITDRKIDQVFDKRGRSNANNKSNNLMVKLLRGAHGNDDVVERAGGRYGLAKEFKFIVLFMLGNLMREIFEILD